MKYAFETAPAAVMYILIIIKTGSVIEKVMGRHTQT
jgi:hypothetical protein